MIGPLYLSLSFALYMRLSVCRCVCLSVCPSVVSSCPLDDRHHLQLVASALRVQKAWRSFREEAPARAAGKKTVRGSWCALSSRCT